MSVFLKPGQISIGPTKGYYCTGDGEAKEFGKGSGGGVPVLNQDFTYTGDCQIIDDSDDTGVNWRIKFLTSGTFISKNDLVIDTFLVGGGGGAYRGISINPAGGGGDGGKNSTAGTPNTGGGGGGGVYATNNRYRVSASAGGSGIVVIRNHREK